MPGMAEQPKRKPKANIVGEPVDWTDDEIDALAEISEEDITSAKATYRRLAPKPAKRLLDALPPDENG